MKLDGLMGFGLALRRIMADPQLRAEFALHAAAHGVEGLKQLLEEKRASLHPGLYRELYILLHERPPPEAPAPGTGIKR